MKVNIVTTLLEVIGLALIIAGVWLAFGTAAACIASGAVLIAMSFLLTTKHGGRS